MEVPVKRKKILLPGDASPVLHAVTAELIVLLVWFDIDVILRPSDVDDDTGDNQHPADGHTGSDPHYGN